MKNKDLQNIKKELETQDNAWTADPIFIVYDIEEIPTHYHYSHLYKWHSEGESYTDEEVKEWLTDNEIDGKKIEFDDDNWEEVAEDNEFEKYYYLEKRRFQAVFFTRKAAQNFIDANHYHFSKPFIYVHSLWRNHEMQGIRNALLKGEFVKCEVGE